MAQKNYDQDDFLISSLVIQRSCCVLVLAYNTVEVVLLQFLEASRVNGVYGLLYISSTKGMLYLIIKSKEEEGRQRSKAIYMAMASL